MFSSLRLLSAVTPVVALLAGECLAATFLAEGYTLRVWQTDDGLPQNTVTSAVQARDGYLCFGTNSGLARFNGERFQVFDSANTPALQDRRVARLFEDAHGTLWIGHESGAITRYREGRFEAFAFPTGTENEKIIGLGSDEQGRLWAMRENGSLDCLDNGNRLLSFIASDRPAIMAWTRSARGSIWLAENGQAARLANGELTSISFDPPRDSNYVLGIEAAADGGAWILCNDRIRKWKDDNWTEDRGDYPWEPGSLSCCLELRDGTLAVGTIRSGLYLIFRDGRPPAHFDRSKGLPQDWVRFLYEDREGNLWAGAGSSGLASIHATAFSVLNSPDQWRGCSVLSVAPGRDDTLWIGTADNGLTRFKNGQFANLSLAQGLADNVVCYILDDGLGYFWLSTHHGIQRVAKEELNRCADGAIPTISGQIYDRSDGLPIVEFLGGRQAAGCNKILRDVTKGKRETSIAETEADRKQRIP